MSNYRDDTQETAVAGSDTWLGLTTIAESVGRITATVLFGLGVLHTDQAAASDTVIDQATQIIVESATASDEFSGSLSASSLITEKGRLSERFTVAHGVLHQDQARVSDLVIERTGALVVDTARIADDAFGQRTGYSLVAEQARISDFSSQVIRDLTGDAVSVSVAVSDSLHAGELISDSVLVSGSALDEHRSGVSPVVELAAAASEISDRLKARDLVADLAVAEDSMPSHDVGAGLAWTASADNWAMSRYLPFGFSRVAVIDGIAYGEAEDGVYALSGGTEQIEGQIVTGKLDVGRGGLAHPIAAYLEYALSGTAEMDVTTTQAGTSQTYTYKLPPEQAGELTNGRFQFGRGLRGRHFSFALRMTGEHGHINDLSVQTAQTKRRV